MSSKFIISSHSRGFRPKLGPIIKRAIEANYQILDDYGITLGKFQGAGYAGCVYQYDKNSVIKFTTNKNEFDLAAFLIDHPETTGFPVIYGVTQIAIPKFKPVFAIIKEDITTIAIPPEFVKTANFLCDAIDPYLDPYSNEEKILDAVDTLDLESQLPEVAEMYYDFTHFLVWCVHSEIYIYDIIDKNLGVRQSNDNKITLVVRDFSACQVF